ncbi:elongation of very long chain fatty acids protein AAEL008004 [Frankliniella occidentalis]|uniref:Elongation of very long chain fatty acids protein n=1 Tax=Frankliniella occidentalis TaxID=133901 RepID=A0A6J1SQ88_FRAOC|nr:elongation of very long chain fatty acids protein AAEL008004 [Frankliniella occidentalis]
MGLAETYHRIFDELSDPRLKDWSLMSSPAYPLWLSIVYLFLVLVAGPRYMKNRPAYKLNTFTFYYNIFQVFACIFILHGCLNSGWLTTYNWLCQPVDYSDSPEAMKMLTFSWLTTWLKLIEFVETIVFVLRKKDRQVSVLHLYHHVSTLWVAWTITKFQGGGSMSFPILPNSIVHIVMYTYYLLTINKNPRLQKILRTIKPYITIMQMIQFCIIIFMVLMLLLPDCPIPIYFPMLFLPNIFLIFYMFYDFYNKNFTKPQQQKVK